MTLLFLFLILLVGFGPVWGDTNETILNTEQPIANVETNSTIFNIQQLTKKVQNKTLQPGKVDVFYQTLGIADELDLLRVSLTILHPDDYAYYGNDPILEMTVSNGRDSVLISLPVIYNDGQLGWSDGKLLDPITRQDLGFRKKKGSENNKTLVITIQSRLNVPVAYQVNQRKLDRGQYVIKFPEDKPTLTLDHQRLTFVKPIGFYVNTVEQKISNIKLTVTSNDTFCATLVTVPHNISIYERSDLLDKSERRLTFTRRADIYFSENELKEYTDFRVFIFVNPNDDECDPDATKREHQNQNKLLNFEFQKIDNSHYFLPILSLFGFFLMPVVALAGYLLFNAERAGGSSIPPLIQLNDSFEAEEQASPSEEVVEIIDDSLSAHKEMLKYPLAIILPVFMHTSTEYHKFTTTSMANLDEICFHNHACAKPLWEFRAFNNIISNIGYLIFGALFVLFSLKRRYWNSQQVKGCGVYESVLLDVTIGLFLMMQAVASATYHICPSDVAIQFDTPCIQVICGLLIIRQWSIRHHTPSPSYSNSLFVAVFFANFMISAFSRSSMIRVFIGAAHILATGTFVKAKYSVLGNSSPEVQIEKPIFAGIFVTLNLLLITIYSIFTGLVHLNQIVTFTMIINCAAYLIYYTLMKIRKQEMITVKAGILGVLAVVFWIFAISCYLQDDIDWTMTPAKSRALNKPCILFDFFGSHDLWHVFSAFSTLFTFLYVAIVDDSLRNFPKSSLNFV